MAFTRRHISAPLMYVEWGCECMPGVRQHTQMRVAKISSRLIEFLSGLVTGCFGFVSACLAILDESLRYWYITIPLFWLLPNLAVALGAYAHALKH